FPFYQSSDELQISLSLAMLGFYKQAFMSLRSALELGRLSVYYNINDNGYKVVQDWLRSKDNWEANTPKATKIWEMLQQNDNIKNFDQKFNIKQQFDDLSFLNNYVHSKGYRYSNLLGIRSKPNHQTFEEAAFIQWLETYEKIVIHGITLHMLKYPLASVEFDWDSKVGINHPFGILREFEIKTIKKFLPPGYLDEIQTIASNDKAVQSFCEELRNSPDITEEEVENQLIENAKLTIEVGSSFIDWEESQLKLMKRYSDEGKEKALNRINIIKKWAIDNNMMERGLKIRKSKEPF
ncbi:MAG TPA: hypothetical protein DCR13_06055, partial [Gammaproteobacteria bacterium]|nr:hypothetical protein [Gammaproteobacteria bacterium]